jgi:hypothetical protein
MLPGVDALNFGGADLGEGDCWYLDAAGELSSDVVEGGFEEAVDAGLVL